MYIRNVPHGRNDNERKQLTSRIDDINNCAVGRAMKCGFSPTSQIVGRSSDWYVPAWRYNRHHSHESSRM